MLTNLSKKTSPKINLIGLYYQKIQLDTVVNLTLILNFISIWYNAMLMPQNGYIYIYVCMCGHLPHQIYKVRTIS